MSPPVTAELITVAGDALADAAAVIDARAREATEQLPSSPPLPPSAEKPQEVPHEQARS